MSNNDVHLTRRHMATLFEFARALRTSIQNINENSYNNFITRIGINIGPVVAGNEIPLIHYNYAVVSL